MTDILQTWTDETAAQAIQENEALFWLYGARVAGWEIHETPGLTWYYSGIQNFMYNGVVRTYLTPREADARIGETLAFFSTRHVPMVWFGGPARRPVDLASRLARYGYHSLGDDPGMAAPLDTLRTDLPQPDGLTMERVWDEATLRLWQRTFKESNESHRPVEAASEPDPAPTRPLTFAADDPFRLYLARLHGQSVATSAILIGAGVAGVYGVQTLPTARRRGIGAAVTLAGLLAARDEGYRLGVLGATEMGFSVYQRLGFRQYCTLQWYARDEEDSERAEA